MINFAVTLPHPKFPPITTKSKVYTSDGSSNLLPLPSPPDLITKEIYGEKTIKQKNEIKFQSQRRKKKKRSEIEKEKG